MAYDKRFAEVHDALAKEVEFTEQASAKIRWLLDDYFRRREEYLERLLKTLEPDRAGAYHSSWLAVAKEAMDAVLSSFKDTEAGKLWLARIANEEHTFFFELYKSQVPVERDRMDEHRSYLQKAMKEFDNKWQAIRDADAQVDAKLKSAAEEYEKILIEAARSAAEAEKESKEQMADTFRKILSAGLRLVDWGPIERALKEGARALSTTLSKAESRKQEIFALMSLEEGVFATFEEAREIVAEFLEENGYPMIKIAWERGDKAADELEGRMVTPGQRGDADEFGDDVKDELKDMFALAEGEYKEFARRHEYLFFGPLGSSYHMELAEDDTWKQFSENWKRHRADFDNLLRERNLQASSDQVLEISLEGIPEEDRRQIADKLEDPLRELLAAWNQWKEFTKDEGYWVLTSREQLKSILSAFR
jgi:hypothetical protein